MSIAYTNHKRLMVSIAFRNCFQFMLSLGLIPLIRKMNLSTGFIKSIKFFSPLKTFVMYFPNGQASSTVTKKIIAAPKISPDIQLEFFRFNQNIQQVYK